MPISPRVTREQWRDRNFGRKAVNNTDRSIAIRGDGTSQKSVSRFYKVSRRRGRGERKERRREVICCRGGRNFAASNSEAEMPRVSMPYPYSPTPRRATPCRAESSIDKFNNPQSTAPEIEFADRFTDRPSAPKQTLNANSFRVNGPNALPANWPWFAEYTPRERAFPAGSPFDQENPESCASPPQPANRRRESSEIRGIIPHPPASRSGITFVMVFVSVLALRLSSRLRARTRRGIFKGC